MKAAMGGGKAKEEVLGLLLARPLKFYEVFMRLEAGCYLQSQWDSMVLSEMKEVKGLPATQLLLSAKGPVERFLEGPAKPFIEKSSERGRGDYPKKIFEETLSFNPSFFSFLRQRETSKALMMKNNYVVSVRGFPGEANRGARALPQRTMLQLQCGSSTQALEIFSYPKPAQTFQWAPDSCGDVFFQMDIGDLVLKKEYSGPLAFPKFLQDFQGGVRTLYPRDFPREEAALEGMGIQHLRVRYEIGGDQVSVRKFTALPEEPPARITRCWDQ
jgi:type VI secretion system protein ImpL